MGCHRLGRTNKKEVIELAKKCSEREGVEYVIFKVCRGNWDITTLEEATEQKRNYVRVL